MGDFEWRLHCLRQSGYPFALATRLALDRRVDLHVACDLLKNGCSVELARRILT